MVKLSESSDRRKDADIGKSANEPPLDHEEAAIDIGKPASNQQNEGVAEENEIAAEPEEKAASPQVRLSEVKNASLIKIEISSINHQLNMIYDLYTDYYIVCDNQMQHF